MNKLWTLLLILGSLVGSAQAQTNRVIEVDVRATFAPISTVGFVFSGASKREYPIHEAVRTAHSTVVRFVVPASEIEPDSFASAMMISADGRTAFGDVRSVLNPSAHTSASTLPECAPPPSRSVATQSDLALFESLLEVRLKRRELYLRRISTQLQGPFLDRMRELEVGFGLTYEESLSPNLEPLVLLDRLTRLHTAIRNYKLALAKQ